MNLKEKIEDLNKMILSGQNMEAFEKYYHNDVVMQENSNPRHKENRQTVNEKCSLLVW